MCHFGQFNLLDASRASIVGRVDVIFCRNVLIYFDVRSRRRVIDTLLRAARPRRLPAARSLRVAAECLDRVRAGAPQGRSGVQKAACQRALGRCSTTMNPIVREVPIKVLVVDDSAFNRRSIADILGSSAGDRGRRQGRRRRRGAAAGRRAEARRDHARPRDAADGRLHVPAHPDEPDADAGDRGLELQPEGERLQGARARRARLRRQARSPHRRRAALDPRGAPAEGAARAHAAPGGAVRTRGPRSSR